MTLVRTFQWSFYLTLALAGLCLAYANFHFLSLMAVFQVVFLVLIVLAFFWEGRRHLGTDGANLLGIFIGILFIFWIYWNIPQRLEDFVGGLPWPARLLPVMAPILPVLLHIKLFRPKTLEDFWSIQVIGLIMVTLSCVLVSEPWFFPLLTLYMVSATWCLGLFYFHQQRSLASHPGKKLSELPLFGPEAYLTRQAAGKWLGLLRAWHWTLPAILLGGFIFLAAPRLNDSQWVPDKLSATGAAVIRTGIGPEMNLTHVGQLEVSHAPAFDVTLYDRDGPLVGIPAGWRWRVQVLDYYRNGKWANWVHSPEYHGWPLLEPVNWPPWEDPVPDPESPPELSKGEVYVAYRVSIETAGGLPLADPIVDVEKIGMWLHTPRGPARRPLFMSVPGTDVFQTPRFRPMGFSVKYGQIVQPQRGLEAIPAVDIGVDYLDHLVQQPVPIKIQEWTRATVAGLKGIAPADLDFDDEGWLAPARHAKVALALTSHLSLSGSYHYSTKLRRANGSMDPVADFLCNVREGHCELFAGGLTLALRSLGIPARVVRGYRGGNYLGVGKVQVMLDSAHAWVEILLPGDEPGKYRWLTLDPTPSAEAAQRSFFAWFWENIQDPAVLWRSLVLDYSPAMQTEVASRLWTTVSPSSEQKVALRETWLELLWPFLIPGLVLAGYMTYQRMARNPGRPARHGDVPHFYRHLLELMERQLRLSPALGQTPLEFARLATTALAADPRGNACQDVPIRIVDHLYRIRFGGLDAGQSPSDALEKDLRRLEEVLG